MTHNTLFDVDLSSKFVLRVCGHSVFEDSLLADKRAEERNIHWSLGKRFSASVISLSVLGLAFKVIGECSNLEWKYCTGQMSYLVSICCYWSDSYCSSTLHLSPFHISVWWLHQWLHAPPGAYSTGVAWQIR